MPNVPVRYGIEGDREVEEAFKRLEATAGKFGEALMDVGANADEGTKRVTDALNEVEKAFEKAAATARQSSEDMAGGAQKAAGATSELGKATETAGKAIDDVGIKIGGFIGGGITAAVAAMAAFSKSGMDSAKQFRELADATGFSGEQLQNWTYGLAKAGGEQKAFLDGLTRFAQQLGRAQNGDNGQIRMFRDLGIEIRDAAGHLRGAEPVFDDWVRAVARMDTQQQRLQASMLVMGKSAKDVQALFENATGRLREFEAVGKGAGAAISDAQQAELKKLEDAWNAFFTNTNASARQWAARNSGWLKDAVDILSTGVNNIVNFDDRFAKPWMARIAVNEAMRLRTAASEARENLDNYLMTTPEIDQSKVVISRMNEEIRKTTAAWKEADEAAHRYVAIAKQGLGIDQPTRIPVIGPIDPPEITYPDPLPQGRGTFIPVWKPPVRGSGGGSHGPDLQKEYDQAKKAVDDYLSSLDREVELSRLTDRQRAITAAGLRAEKLAIEEVNAAKKLGVDIDREAFVAAARQQAEAAAGQNYDLDRAKREADRQREQALQAELKRWERAADRMQDTIADAIYGGLRDGSLRAGDIWRSLGDVVRRQIAESLAAGVVLPIRAVFGQLAGGMGLPGLGGPPGANGLSGTAAGSAAGGGMFGNPFGALMPQGSFGFLSRPIFGPSASAYEGVIEGVSGADAARYFGDPTGGALGGLTWGQGLGSLAMAGGGAYQMTQGGIGNLIAGGSSIVGAGLNLVVPGLGTAVAMGGQLLGAILGHDTPSPQAAANIVLDRTAAPWAYASTALAQDRDNGNVTGVNTGANSIATQINRTLWQIGARPGAGFQSGYLLNSQGQNTGDQWIVGMGAYGTAGATELANGLSSEQAVSRLLNETFTRAAQGGELQQAISGAWSQSIVTALAHIDVEDQGAIDQAIRTARAYDELLETGRAADSVRDQFEQLGEEFRALEFEAGRLGLNLDDLHEAESRRLRGMWDDTTLGWSDTVLGLKDPKALELARNDRWISQQIAIVQAYVDEGVASVAEGEARIAEIREAGALQQQQITERYTQQSVSGLQDLYRRLVYGDLSGASPVAALAGAEATFSTTFQSALGPNASAQQVGNFLNAAQQYAQLALQTHGIGGDFRTINELVRAAVAAVTQSQGGTLPTLGTGTVAVPEGSSTSDPQIAALIDSINRLIARLPAA